ncbi:MAG TPA: 50S ribosomal protein L25 [Clostridiales bacterium]|nr:50S ribosomal protein L25 [Clostridiales bacterium]
MAVDAVLKFEARSNSKNENKRLIKEGFLLGNVNCRGLDSVAVAVRKEEFRKVYKKYGRNCILKLEGEDQQDFEVMVKAIQTNPKDYDYQHVDFQKVLFTDAVKADVAIRYTGIEFLQAKRLVLNRLFDVIPVVGLPQDIPHVIEFDLSNAKAADNILVGDLAFPEGITPEMDKKQLIASVIEV